MALPLVGYVVANLIWHVRPLVFFHRIPLLSKLAMTTGLLLGIGVIAASPERPSFDINAIVADGGAWDVTWRRFLTDIANPGLYRYDALWSMLSSQDLSGSWMIYGVAVSAALLASAIATLVMLRGEEFLIGVFAMMYEILLMQALAMYVIMLLAYTLCTFNFWTALLALMILQYYRYVQRPAGH
ncbi:hypothetical protein SAMN05660686_01389 [Thalassobaculum litoreum DSM 18839]|uniref:Uncharacterized protein n=1 Tax=Thalassobaculum litoreum DSM 18839 TaxID=1123362 RepID=A0A8G2BGP3_9PROT|nr:hypothetical protein SAMN05660686_01389 [Thalassobaculum litoreum DSM 18839]